MYLIPNVGDAITYRMRLSERPVNPLRLWHGVVEKVWPNCCRVRLIDVGYEDYMELVIFYQIVNIEGGQGTGYSN
jgi:hypothetical protein